MQKMCESGSFIIGCNYWASHAGTNMWHDWDESSIEHDFALLSQHNIRYVRLFPLWPDFQPLRMHYKQSGDEKELRLRELPLPHTEAGRAGVDEVMVERFRTVCDIAQRHGLHLIVGLVTGWMSGRLYVPEPFLTVNVLTDARAIKWQTKFVKYMVSTFKDHPAIVAWDLGNECNCMGHCPDADAAYTWANAITMAIKTCDPHRPVISGMHGTFPEAEFRPQDLGEILDVLCPHPYPLFTPHCATDPLAEQKSLLHATAETVLYRGLSGKPAFAEEVGTLGPMIADEATAAAYIHTILHLLWAHDCLGLLWWCGFEQSHLTHTPYDWNAVERQLGLFRADYSPKPVLSALSRFAAFIDRHASAPLPPRIVDAVCILTAEEDSWRTAYGSFLLAKQAGLDIEFCHIEDALPEASAYLLPSIAHDHVSAHSMKRILARVAEGATLYVSIGDALLSPFSELFGLVPRHRFEQTAVDPIQIGDAVIDMKSTHKIVYDDGDATVLARDDRGNAVFAEHAYGHGHIYFLSYPLEDMAAAQPGVISGEGAIPYHLFYRAMPRLRSGQRVVSQTNPYVVWTEHIDHDGKHTVVAVNTTPRTQQATFTLPGYTFTAAWEDATQMHTVHDGGVAVTLPANETFIFDIIKKCK